MTFEFDAENYRKASTHQKEWAKRLMSELSLGGNERILDLGSGDGDITTDLAKRVQQGFVMGIDSSRHMVESARKTHTAANLRFELMDINDMHFDAEFDVVFSNATLHWIKDHAGLLASVFRSLRKGGLMRFNFAGDGNCSNLIRVLTDTMAESKYLDYFKNFEWPWYMLSVDEYTKIAAESDFSETRVWGENADKYFPDAKAMIRWIDQPSIVPFLKCIDDAEKESFRDAVVRRMIQATIQDDGTCFEPFRRINVLVKKNI